MAESDPTARLCALLSQSWPSARERAEAVEAFCAREGDPRFRADAWFLPDDAMLGFIEVPAGPFLMGSDYQPFSDEQPAHEWTLPLFYVARYPVTVAQFRAFVDTSGFAPANPAWSMAEASQPVTSVSWNEALAYCAWLDGQLRSAGGLPVALARLFESGDAWRVMLPSEAEWEKAARGVDGYRYPWWDFPDSSRANYDDTSIDRPSTVGCFPDGTSSYGIEDMSGNVWEWTRSLWGRDGMTADFRYPYDPADGREDLAAPPDVLRVVRGGSFADPPFVAAAHVRFRNYPDDRGCTIGFRIALSQCSPA
jgi:formylglycine-generating enzyme required for sulfatase activity